MLSDVARRVRTAEIAPSTADDPPELGGYEIRGRLGHGGMGVVYLGATRSGRLLAIKVIHPDRTDETEFRARFRREVSAAMKVRSHRTAAVIDFDVDATRPWLATEYVPGPTLAQAVAELGSLPEPAVNELVTGLAEALATIHRAGLVHRDVKPANVLLGPDGPVLIDLGVVSEPDATSLTSTGAQPGTPQFMSPEQALGQSVTGASDVWSLGVVAQVAATGAGPFGTGRLATVTYRIVHEAPDLDTLPTALRHLVGACLVKDPAGRPTATALLASLAEPADTATHLSGAHLSGSNLPGPDLPGPDLPRPDLPRPDLPRPDLPDDDTVLRGTASSAAPAPAAGQGVPAPNRTRRRVVTGLVAAGLVLAGGGGTAALVHFLPSDDAPAASSTPRAGAATSTSPSGSPSPSRPSKEPTKKPSATPTSSPDATPRAGAGSAVEDAAPAQFQQGTVVLPTQLQVGQELTAETTGWAPQPATTACLWSIGGVERDNLGSCTYTVALDDVGKAVQVRLTAARSGYAKATALSNATETVPQPTVRRPDCSISLTPGKKNAGWLAHCGVDKDPNVAYTWTWVDVDIGETIDPAQSDPGQSTWIHGGHHGHLVRVTVQATRSGYRSAEFSTTLTLPDKWVPRG